jgi:hypothetical protein
MKIWNFVKCYQFRYMEANLKQLKKKYKQNTISEDEILKGD